MVSLRRHFVPNPVPFSGTAFAPPCKLILVLHTRYDAANQLQTGKTSSGTTTYLYDAAGNLQVQRAPGDQRTTSTWDAENRLSRVTLPSGSITTMLYTPDGLRVRRDDANGTAKFVWDGERLLLETGAQDATQVVYTLAPGGFGPLVSQRRSGTSRFYHFDAIDATLGLSGNDQSLTDTYAYEAFGALAASSGSTVNSFRYVGGFGYYYDSALARYYVRARHYDRALARWLSQDPVYSDPNLYRYCGNSPVLHVDPAGLWGRDVHYDMTNQLAALVGISCPKEIAAGAQRPDDPKDPRNPMGLSAILSGLLTNLSSLTPTARAKAIADARRITEEMLKYHFPREPNGQVVGGGPAARALVEEGIKKCDFKLFSEGLHAYQDSFSHVGQPPLGGLGGHDQGVVSLPNLLQGLLNVLRGDSPSMPEINIQLKGILAALSSSTDAVSNRNESFRNMAHGTFVLLERFSLKCKDCLCPESQQKVNPNPGAKRPTRDDLDGWLEQHYPGPDKITPR